jgi:hypothetical protein
MTKRKTRDISTTSAKLLVGTITRQPQMDETVTQKNQQTGWDGELGFARGLLLRLHGRNALRLTEMNLVHNAGGWFGR